MEDKSPAPRPGAAYTEGMQAPMIDLRSDTVTLPTEAMKRAAIGAELGDDVYREDPTVNDLERHGAVLLGKEAALFMPTGTMANLCAMLTHCARGTRVVVGHESHVYRLEAGGASALGGLVLDPIRNLADGTFDPTELAAALESPEDPHVAPAGLLALENTHNRTGGAVIGPSDVARYAAAAHARSVPVHLDGARLFNAAVALGVDAGALAAAADSVQICFSKGLSAPAGSMLLGTAAFIERARRVRKMLGGGLRQAGVLAAACRVGLDTGVARLADDHLRARRLAAGIASATESIFAVGAPASNMVLVHLCERERSAFDVVAELRAQGVLVGALDGARLRAVLHAGIDDEDVERAVVAFGQVCRRSLAGRQTPRP